MTTLQIGDIGPLKALRMQREDERSPEDYPVYNDVQTVVVERYSKWKGDYCILKESDERTKYHRIAAVLCIIGAIIAVILPIVLEHRFVVYPQGSESYVVNMNIWDTFKFSNWGYIIEPAFYITMAIAILGALSEKTLLISYYPLFVVMFLSILPVYGTVDGVEAICALEDIYFGVTITVLSPLAVFFLSLLSAAYIGKCVNVDGAIWESVTAMRYSGAIINIDPKWLHVWRKRVPEEIVVEIAEISPEERRRLKRRRTIATVIPLTAVAVIILLSMASINEGSLDFTNREVDLIVTDSMDGEPREQYAIKTIPKGALVMVRYISDQEKYELQVGDVIQFNYKNLKDHHRVIENNPDERYVVTKGDNSSAREHVPYEDINGMVIGESKWMGDIVTFAKKNIILIVGGLISLLIGLFLLDSMRRDRQTSS